MEVKIIPESGSLQMEKTKKNDVSDNVEFLVVKEEYNAIVLYAEGESSERNFVEITLTQRQARHLATAISELLK